MGSGKVASHFTREGPKINGLYVIGVYGKHFIAVGQ